MSRCFPFPPPGYEKKARTEDEDILKKEKHREKKHKKEKKDKERREGKEKKDKDRSDGKHREKKDKKEKHRDKKKNKEKDRDKDRSIIPDEKKLQGLSECQKVEKISDEKHRPGHSESCSGEKVIQKEKERDKDRNPNIEKSSSGLSAGFRGENLGRNSHQREKTADAKSVQDFGKRSRDDGRGTGNQVVNKFTGTEQKKNEGMVKLVAKAPETWAEWKEKNSNNRIDERKMDGQRSRDEARYGANPTVQNLSGFVHGGVEVMPKPFEKNIERRMEWKEKNKEKEDNDKHGDKHRDKDREKKVQGKEKEKKKEEKGKEENKINDTEQDKPKDSNNHGILGSHNTKTLNLPKDRNKSAAIEGILRKRKDTESNGFLHANDHRPNKLPRPTVHPLTQNGRVMETCEISTPSTSERQGIATNLKVERKECIVNGLVEGQLSFSPTKSSSLATVKADEIAETSVKSPHPDLKYLSKVLSVPKIEELPEDDDQWLTGCSDLRSKKPKSESSVVEEKQVWAEAMQIDSADVVALPYVIPY